ncbi:aspartate racemase [Brevibacterium antiquum]|uniref:aspartate/glutamate racemase family protein n=1 Tax=Brevibacterium antiquum TaxID=234835 RepID=UPI0018DFE644|nr:amino acid racemase [Brevibacterium antiquum]
MPDPTADSRTIGILGGMGPAATVDFYDKLVRCTPGSRDQEHLRVALWADPTVPDRIRALAGTGPDPTPWLEQGIAHLIACGAEILVVPCNTIHIYLPKVMRNKDIEFISIIDAAVDAAVDARVDTSIGLLATDATLASCLYQQALEARGLKTILPSPEMQSLLKNIIGQVKAGNTGQQVRDDVSTILKQLGDTATAAIAACTEISVILNQIDSDIRIIDPSLALARKAVKRAQAPLPLTVRGVQLHRSNGEENR